MQPTQTTAKNLPPFNSSGPTKEKLFYIRPGDSVRCVVEIERDEYGKFRKIQCPVNPSRYWEFLIDNNSLLGRCGEPNCRKIIQFFREPVRPETPPESEVKASEIKESTRAQASKTGKKNNKAKTSKPTPPSVEPEPEKIEAQAEMTTVPETTEIERIAEGDLKRGPTAEPKPSQAAPEAEEHPAPEGTASPQAETSGILQEADTPPQGAPEKENGEPGPEAGLQQVEQVDWENFLKGAFLVSRSLFNSEVWVKSPLHRDIWVWLIGKASYRDRKDGDFICSRGELYTTYTEIIDALKFCPGHRNIKPSIQQVRDVLNWFVNQGMIEKNYVKPGKISPRSPRVSPRLPNYCAVKEQAIIDSKEQSIITDLYRTGALRIKLINYDPYQTLQNYIKGLKNRGKEQATNEEKEQAKKNDENRVRTPPQQATPRKPAIIKGSDSPKKGKNLNNNKNHYVEGSDELRLTALLLEEIRKAREGLGVSPIKPPNLQTWGKYIDLLIRVDGITPERIEEVIKYCQRSYLGRNGNLLSTEKLRKHFKTLEQQMASEKKGKASERLKEKPKILTAED